MGGSFALAARQAGLVGSIAGYSASENTRQTAVQLQVIDQACSSVAQAVQGADLVLLAVPVGAMLKSFEAMRDVLFLLTLSHLAFLVQLVQFCALLQTF
jgi:prephenate dehydrogenase